MPTAVHTYVLFSYVRPAWHPLCFERRPVRLYGPRSSGDRRQRHPPRHCEVLRDDDRHDSLRSGSAPADRPRGPAGPRPAGLPRRAARPRAGRTDPAGPQPGPRGQRPRARPADAGQGQRGGVRQGRPLLRPGDPARRGRPLHLPGRTPPADAGRTAARVRPPPTAPPHRAVPRLRARSDLDVADRAGRRAVHGDAALRGRRPGPDPLPRPRGPAGRRDGPAQCAGDALRPGHPHDGARQQPSADPREPAERAGDPRGRARRSPRWSGAG